jgi:mannose/cellobiose epimerase-like protein (N-acyl-D-glucosamine 2-epimerase family)
MTVTADRILAWLAHEALPLWSHAGLDSSAGGFTEALTLDGRPLHDRDKRLRVQARQTYVYSHAHLLGWTPPAGGPSALEAATAGFAFMTGNYWNAEGGGFVFSAARNGTPADRRVEAYEQAFALLACAWYHRASGDAGALDWAARIAGFLDDTLADPTHGGYFENPARDLPRRQNPHMHLLEALLAVHEATGDTAWLERARAIVSLFREHFFDADTGTLGEFFGADWSPAPGTAGQTVEPGHHFEWVWLLDRYGHASGDPTAGEAAALYRFAEDHGTDHAPGPATGLAYDSILRRGEDPRLGHGASLDENKRLWVQTEAIKAQLVQIERGGDANAEARLDTLLDRLFGLYLAVGHGNWQDHLDRGGRGFAESAPASSLYHLFLALTEVLRVRDGIETLA